jgi:hypothetical protein
MHSQTALVTGVIWLVFIPVLLLWGSGEVVTVITQGSDLVPMG